MNSFVDPDGSNTGWAREGRQPRIAVIGAGFSGMAALIKLAEAGYTDLSCFEKAEQLGGTWRDNSYPGLSCDIPSHWYSFSFEPNPDWSHRYSYGPEILAYQKQVAEKYGLDKIIRFADGVEELRYLGPQWLLTSAKGGEQVFDFVVAATGVLRNPAYPDIPGLKDFQGACFHSARWDHSVDLKGKRVAVIGTGSTACQIVGAIAPEVAHLDVYQRTPHWLGPLHQKAYSPRWQSILAKFPWVQTFIRGRMRRGIEGLFGRATLGDARRQRWVQSICMRHLRKQVPDAALRARLTPDFKATCKRLILCSDYYPALMQDHVELVTDPITGIEAGGVRCGDGQLREADVLVLATGFQVDDFILPTEVYGEEGQSLRDFWSGLPRAHRAMTFPGFPNFLMLEGPTGVFGNTSLIDVSESQVAYLIKMLNLVRDDKLLGIAPTREAYERYNEKMAAAIVTSTWATGGCDSWYLDKSGSPNIYPWLPKQYRRDMQEVDHSEYRLIGEIPVASEARA